MWKLPNGKVQRVPKGVRIGDTNYPASIFRRWSTKELNAVGIFPYKEVKFDQKWYKSTGSEENEVGGEIVKSHTIVKRHTNEKAKDSKILDVKSQYISEKVRAEQNEDFYDAIGDNVTKKVWSDYILALKKDAKDLKTVVNNAGTYAAIINLKFQWTEAPDGSV